MPIDIVVKYHAKALRVRNIDRMLEGDLFREAWQNANHNSKMELEERLKGDDCEWYVKDWIQRHLDKDIRNWSYRKLRDTAKLHNVPRYSQMTKDQLAEALCKRRLQI